MQTSIDVLIVDDCDADAEAMLLALHAAAPQASVLRLKDGEQALQFMFATGGFAGRETGMPRLILLEVKIPLINGLTVLEILRKHPSTSAIPVVLLTSSGNPLAIENSHALGASGCIVKPAELERYRAELAGIVRRWLPDLLRLH